MTPRKTSTARLRLQKFLSEAGVASRRRAEELIAAGRVLVNDTIVQRLPAFVDPEHDRVVVDGTPVRIQALEYFLLHKPKGVVCTNRDPAGRLRAIDLLPPMKARLNVVGRLDADSSGLLLMTNDGQLAEQITHPRSGVPKVYRVEVRGRVPNDIPAQMKKGVRLAEGKATASEVEIVHRSRQSSALRITLREGRNRQVRRMLVRLGHPAKKLKRVQIGPLRLTGLPVGACRRLTARELEGLRRAVRSPKPKPRAGGARPPRTRKSAPATSQAKRSAKAGGETTSAKPGRRAGVDRDELARPRRRLVT